MTDLKRWQGYPAMSRPLTIWGVERRWFLLTCTFGVATWNAVESIFLGAFFFGILFAAGAWAWKKDPAMLMILKEASRYKARYDSGKWAETPWTIVLR